MKLESIEFTMTTNCLLNCSPTKWCITVSENNKLRFLYIKGLYITYIDSEFITYNNIDTIMETMQDYIREGTPCHWNKETEVLTFNDGATLIFSD